MVTKEKLKSCVEIVSNVGVIALVAFVIAAFALNYRKVQPQLQPGLQKRAVMRDLQGVKYADSRQTLVIGLSTRCEYCDASVSFYNHLAEFQRNKAQTVRIIAVFPNSLDEVLQYVEQTQLKLRAIPAADFVSLNVNGTPTMILVDDHGRIIDFWVGKLSSADEQHVIRNISS